METTDRSAGAQLLQLLLKIARDVAAPSDRDACLRTVVDRIAGTFRSATHVSIFSAPSGAGGIALLAESGIGPEGLRRDAGIPEPGSAIATALATRALAVVPGEGGGPPAGAMSRDTRSAACVPLIVNGRIVSLLYIESRDASAFGAGEAALIEMIGINVAQRLETIALNEIQSERSTKVQMLADVRRRVLAAPSLDDAMRAVVESVVDEYGYDCACIALLSVDGRFLEHRTHHARVPVGVPAGYRQEIDRGLVGRAARERRTVCCNDVSLEPGYVSVVPGVRSELCIPLLGSDGLIGVLDVNGCKPDAFHEEDVQILETLGGQIGLVVEKARDLDRARRTRDYLENLVACAGDGITTLSGEGRITRWNGGMERLLGYGSESMVGRHFRELPWESPDPAGDAIVHRAGSGEIIEGLERRLVCRDGRVIDVALTMSPVEAGGRSEGGVSIVVRDVTERNRMERGYREMHLLMRASEEKFLALIERSRDAVFFVEGTTGVVVQANARAEAMTGLNRTDLVGFNLDDLHPAEEWDRARRHLQAAVASGAGPALDLRLCVKDGPPLEVEVTPSLLSYGGRHLIQWLCRDISERRRAEREREALQQQLVQSEKLSAVGQLISGVAHELNNPLTGVIGYAQLLSSHDCDERIRRGLDKVYAEAKRCHRIVQNLLGFARKHLPERRRINVNEVVESVIELRAYQLRADGIRLEAALSPDIPLTTGDFHQLQQVFMNILINAHQAIRHAGQGTAITVRTEPSEEMIFITIADDGPGIPEGHINRVFDPFFTTKEPGQGTGLGLSLCYGIVREHQGTITARSLPGEGAVFTIKLPVTDAEIATPPGDAAQGSLLDKNGSSRYL